MNEQRWLIWFRVIGDLFIGFAAYYAVFWIRLNVSLPFTDKLLPELTFNRLSYTWSWVVLLQGSLLYFMGAYESDTPDRKSIFVRATLAAAGLTTLLLIAFFFFLEVRFPRTVFLLFFALDFPLLLAWQALAARLRIPSKSRRALVVGVNETSAALVREIQRRPFLGIDVVGLVYESETLPENGTAQPAHAGLPILGARGELVRIAAQHGVEQIILTPTPSWQDRLIDELGQLHDKRARVSLVPSPFEIMIGKPQQQRVHDIPLIEFIRVPMGPASRLFKRVMDLVMAVFLGILVIPVLAGAAAVIAVVSPGPIFYRQVRVGRHGKSFSITKLRTMVVNAEQATGAVLAQKNDPRIFPFGRFLRKTRIDELPQLFSILTGDMSFVGPRPERPEFVEQFRREIPGYAERLRVKPGATGLAQVNGYYETTAENKLKFDLSYIYNYSLALDLRILLETVKVVLTGRGT